MRKELALMGVVLVILGGWWLFVGQKKEVREEKITPAPVVSPVSKEGGEEKMKILMVVAPKDFRDEELFETREVLEKEGIKVEVGSKGTEEAQGMLGGVVKIDKDINEVEVDDYQGIVFVGGTGASVYFNDPRAQTLAKDFADEDKLVAAICIAPSILANSGLLEGKKATCFSSEAENLKSQGAEYTGQGVTVDGRIITAQGPDYATQFGEAIAEKLRGD